MKGPVYIAFSILALTACQPKNSFEANKRFDEFVSNQLHVECSIGLVTIQGARMDDQGQWSAKWRCNDEAGAKILWLSTDEYGRVSADVEGEHQEKRGALVIDEYQN